MMITTTTKVFLLLATNLAVSTAHFNRFYSGDCPRIQYPTMRNFDIDKYLGEWYVIETYNENSLACLAEHFNRVEANVTVPSHNNDINLEMKMKMEKRETEKDVAAVEAEKEEVSITYVVNRSYLPLGARKFTTDTGAVKFVNAEDESEMEIGYPYTETGMLNLKHYQVVATDYFSYALVWRCQATLFGHRRTAQIMSRKRTLSKEMLEEIRAMIKLIEQDSNVSFQPVRQTDCTETSNTVAANDTNEQSKPATGNTRPGGDNKFEMTKFIHISHDRNNNNNKDKNKEKEKKKLLSIDVGGFHLSISFPFW